jgi:hypothetical protein
MTVYCRMCQDYVEGNYSYLDTDYITNTTPSVGACSACITKLVNFERKRNIQAIMDLFFALREWNGTPTLRDLVKLAKRIKSG